MLLGFDSLSREHILNINLELQDDHIRILIKENGKGIEPALVEEINHRIFRSSDRGGHIGMENVISRLSMYYYAWGNRGLNQMRVWMHEY